MKGKHKSTLRRLIIAMMSLTLVSTLLAAAAQPAAAQSTANDDTTAPVVNSLSLVTSSVDITSGPVTVTMTNVVTDDISGTSIVSVRWESPSGNQIGHHIEWPGSSLQPLELPQYSETGAWEIASVEVTDNAGNSDTLTAADLTALGITLPTLTVTGTGDTTPPVFSSLSLSATTVDITSSDVNIDVTFGVTDALSGVDWTVVFFESPSGQQQISAQNVGTVHNLQVPQYAEAGTWTITNLIAYDMVGNEASFNFLNLASIGFPLPTLEVTGTSDTTAPVFNNVWFDIAYVDVTSGPGTLDLTIDVTDDLSGVADYSIILIWDSPSGVQQAGAGFYSPTDGSAVVNIPQHAESGTWTMNAFQVQDNSGNFSRPSLENNFTGIAFTLPTFVVCGAGCTPTVDLCPSVAGAQMDDADGDGLGDECDNCVFDSNADQADADGDGIGDACTPPTLTLVKVVDGGTAVVSDFVLEATQQLGTTVVAPLASTSPTTYSCPAGSSGFGSGAALACFSTTAPVNGVCQTGSLNANTGMCQTTVQVIATPGATVFSCPAGATPVGSGAGLVCLMPNFVTTTFTSGVGQSVSTGPIVMGESGGPADYVGSDWDCVDADGNAFAVVDGDTIDLAAGDDVTCTITNTYVDPCVAVPQAGSLEGWWDFDGDFDEKLGRYPTGVATGSGVGFDTTGYVGSSVAFDGTGDKVEIDVSAMDLGTGGFSADMWIKLNDTTAGIDSLVTLRDIESDTNGWGIYLWEASPGSFQPGILLPNPSLDPFSANSTVAIPQDDEWHLLTMTVAADGTLTVYLDDNVSSPFVWATGATPDWKSDDMNLIIGKDFDTSNPFDGHLDELELFSTVLTPADVQALYDAGPAGKCDPVDTDGDGVFDIVDNCVNDPNADQADADADGIGDACDSDNCTNLAPANNAWADAEVIGATLPATVTGTNECADGETDEPAADCRAYTLHSVWWSFTPATSGDFVIDVAGQDPVLEVFTGSAIDSLTSLGCDDDGGPGYDSQMTVSMTSGTTYWVRVDGYSSTQSPVTVTVSAVPSPYPFGMGHNDWAGWREDVMCGPNGATVTVDLSLGQMPTSGHDVILGTPGDDVINTLGGDDLVCAGDGNDTIYGVSGSDIIFGQGGNDIISAGPGDDFAYGGDGDDWLYGVAGNDELAGGPGNDVLSGGADDDLLDWSDDMSRSAGDDILFGGSGNDIAFGGYGDDLISMGGGDDLAFGHDGHDTLLGGDGVDGLIGDEAVGFGLASWPAVTVPGMDIISAGEGDDPVLIGGANADQIFGGPGMDVLTGNDGDDVLSGGTEDDIVHGGAGVDQIFGGLNDDVLNGDDGEDTLSGGPGMDTINGGNDDDLLFGGPDSDMLFGDAGADSLYAGTGDDSLDGGDDNDPIIHGQAGTDTCDVGAGGGMLFSCEL